MLAGTGAGVGPGWLCGRTDPDQRGATVASETIVAALRPWPNYGMSLGFCATYL